MIKFGHRRPSRGNHRRPPGQGGAGRRHHHRGDEERPVRGGSASSCAASASSRCATARRGSGATPRPAWRSPSPPARRSASSPAKTSRTSELAAGPPRRNPTMSEGSPDGRPGPVSSYPVNRPDPRGRPGGEPYGRRIYARAVRPAPRFPWVHKYGRGAPLLRAHLPHHHHARAGDVQRHAASEPDGTEHHTVRPLDRRRLDAPCAAAGAASPSRFRRSPSCSATRWGHYVTCRIYGIPCTPPYFLPSPLNFGTFGAFIRIKAPIYSKRQLFDVGSPGRSPASWRSSLSCSTASRNRSRLAW